MPVIDELMIMENWWYDSDVEKAEYIGKKVSQCHFVPHKFHIYWHGIEPGFPWQ